MYPLEGILLRQIGELLFGKMGLNYILLGRDKGHLSLRIGGGYVLEMDFHRA